MSYMRSRPYAVDQNEVGSIMRIIADFITENGYSPTVREIQQRSNFASTDTVQRMLVHLREKGYVTQVPGRARTIRVLKMPEGAA